MDREKGVLFGMVMSACETEMTGAVLPEAEAAAQELPNPACI